MHPWETGIDPDPMVRTSVRLPKSMLEASLAETRVSSLTLYVPYDPLPERLDHRLGPTAEGRNTAAKE